MNCLRDKVFKHGVLVITQPQSTYIINAKVWRKEVFWISVVPWWGEQVLFFWFSFVLQYVIWKQLQIIYYIKILFLTCSYNMGANDIHRQLIFDRTSQVFHSVRLYIRLGTVSQRKDTCCKGCTKTKGKHFSNPGPPSHTVCVGMSNTPNSCCTSCRCLHILWLCHTELHNVLNYT